MDGAPQVTPEALRQRLEGDIAQMIQRVTAAVNAAEDGAWIAQSEDAVRQALAALRQRTFQEALQLKVDAAEGAFSPSGPGGGLAEQRPRPAAQGHHQRLGGTAASPL